MLIVLALLGLMVQGMSAQTIKSPDGKILVFLELKDQGKPYYRVNYQGREVVKPSALGLVTNIGDFTQGLEQKGVETREVTESYELRDIKQSHVDYRANEAVVSYTQKGEPVMDIIFRVSNRDVAFCYRLHDKKPDPMGNTRRVCVVEREASSFTLPDGTTTFLCPQSEPMVGFARTMPSYETPYTLDEPMGKNGWGNGYTFPCLFKEQNCWVSSARRVPTVVMWVADWLTMAVATIASGSPCRVN